jgi:uncharacterized phage protein gp47/JayE
MAILPTKSFTTIVTNIATGIQGRANTILDFSIGSSLRALAEGFSGILLWLQALALQIAQLTRASTSQGSDLDSWMADWNFLRLGAQSATGTVTFSRNTAGTNAPFIPIGATIQSIDGTATFTVTVDLGNPNYVGTPIAGYNMPANIASITVPVQCTTVGTAGNVVAGALSQITTPLVGIDTVVNAIAFTNGFASETDAAYRSRFIGFIAALSKGTVAAIEFSVTTTQLGAQVTVLENVNADLTANPGFLTVTVDDGTGAPNATFITNAALAVGATRAGGVMWGVFPPVIIYANIGIILTSVAGYDHGFVVSVVSTAVLDYVNTLPLGQPLYYNRLAQVIFDATPGVLNISPLSINGNTIDLVGTLRNVVKIGTLTVV